MTLQLSAVTADDVAGLAAVREYEHLGFVPTEQFERHTHAEIGLSYLRLDLNAYCEGRTSASGDLEA